MELKQYAYLIWKWMWLIVLVTVLAAVAAYVTSRLTTPVYEASTLLLIDEAPDTKTTDYTAILTSQRLAATYAEMITTDAVLEETIQRLGMDMNPESLKGSITVQLIRDTQLIEIKVEDVNPFVAADLADTLFEVFNEQNEALRKSRFGPSKENLSAELLELEDAMQGLETSIAHLGSPKTEVGKAELSQLKAELAQYQDSYTRLLQTYEELRLAEAQSASNIVQIESAKPAENPIRPRTMMNTLLAAIVGAMLAVGGVFLIDYLDDTIKTADEASHVLGLPVIAFIAHTGENHLSAPVVISEPRSPTAEAFRSFRSNIQFAGVDKPIRTLLVTSPNPQVGKSTVAVNLALVIAQSGKNVLLIDSDMRRSRIHHFLGLPNQLGLSDIFLRETSGLNGIFQQWKGSNLYVLTSGRTPPNPAELLASERMAQCLELMVKKYDLVIIDSPPVGVVTDPVVLAARVDATVLVIEPNRTQLGSAQYAVEQLGRAGANLIGMVFNNVPVKRAGYYTGKYYYYTEYYGNGRNGKGAENGKAGEAKKRESGSVGDKERGRMGARENG